MFASQSQFFWVNFSAIGVQLCSIITAIFMRRHFSMRLNCLRFDSSLYLFFTFFTTTISRFWIFWGRGFIMFNEKNPFLSHRYKFGTCGNKISTRFWSASIPSLWCKHIMYTSAWLCERVCNYESVNSLKKDWLICSCLKSLHHSGFRLPFNSGFRVSTSTERAVWICE